MKKILLLSLALILGAATMAQSKVGTQLLSQDFTTAATGWTFDAQAANWVTSASANAGGVAPEAKMNWSPQFNGTTRLISPVVDASGHSNLNIEFKHAIDHYSGGYTVGLATRSKEGDWHTVWSRSGATVVESINVVIENEDLGSSSFQFCLFFSGSSYNINAWYIDDILLYAPFETDLAVNSINNEAYSLFGNRNVAATVKNVGINPITSFDIQYQVNEEVVITENVTGVSITSGSSYNHTFTSVWEATAGTYNVSVGLININGNGDDDDMSNNSKTKSIHLASQAVANIPLYESFTSSTCGPCNTFNTGSFSPFLIANAGKLAIIKYQMNWPGSGDPYYTDEGGVRRGYYGVNGVPALFAGGSSIPTSATGLTNAFNALTAKDAFFEIDVNANIAEDKIVFASIDILPHITVNNFKLHAAIVERETTGNAGNNGETSFKYVMMKMLPSANGTVISSTDGEALSFELSADLTSTNVEEFNDLMVVVFIQNDETKEIFQSAMVDVTLGNVVNSTPLSTLSIYPNPTQGEVTIKMASEEEVNTIEIYSITGALVYSKTYNASLSEVKMNINQPQGVYMVRVTLNNGNTSIGKLIVK
ncbi:MAG: T9SS type A sorting domain-containing protein [Bacteroidales bacterium]|nr:T9SS type A sorting domain-containing protein [Bacteroidales bacterium]MDD4385782.1 T9SS type A sorting domain-containing protein [Bacteroidales bacterium]MDY0197917.1 T9SS type A sorting domain-containing protein [Tenuifilaceae bacterium]